MTSIKEFNLIEVHKNSEIINSLKEVYKLWGYEEVSPSMINDIETIKSREVIDEKELIKLVTNKSLCLRPEMTTSIVKLISTRLINKKRPLRLWNTGIVFEKEEGYKKISMLKEKIQSGIELIGYDTDFPEIELINILFDSIKKLNLKENCTLKFLVSSTTIMDLILKKYKGVNYENVKKCMTNLDQDNLYKLSIEEKDKLILKELLFLRGEPNFVIDKLNYIFGDNKVLEDLRFLFNIISPLANKNNIQIQLDPTFQPHLNLYAGIVFQLICINNNEKYVIAKGGRYDELVKYFNPNEKTPIGLGFSVSIDNLRKLIDDQESMPRKILILFRDKKLLPKAIEEQERLHRNGTISILEINPCMDEAKAEIIRLENKCSEIQWIS